MFKKRRDDIEEGAGFEWDLEGHLKSSPSNIFANLKELSYLHHNIVVGSSQQERSA